MREIIDTLEAQKNYITYADLKPGGILSDVVKDFAFFPDFDSNDAFLDVINFSEVCEPGNGLCENLARYSKISVSRRKEYNDNLKATKNRATETDTTDDEEVNNNHSDDMSISSDEGHTLEKVNTRKRSGPPANSTAGKLYCFYVRCNLTMKRVTALFGVTSTLVHDIVYAWANLQYDVLEQLFPAPTRSHMLRAYPKSHIQKHGNAQVFMLLDAKEGFADTASMKTVNAILYSAYKHHSTMKWLVRCDPIGTVWNDSISDGHGGSISDPMFTYVTNILEQIPAGSGGGQRIFNREPRARLGIFCVCPMKCLKKQQQQCQEDVALTQKVGKNRIAIKQANGQMKQSSASFFDENIRIQQIGLADLIFRASYLLTNFKLGVIQDKDRNDAANDDTIGCQRSWLVCRGRWSDFLPRDGPIHVVHHFLLLDFLRVV